MLGLMRANGIQYLTAENIVDGSAFDYKRNKHFHFRLSDEALRELSDGFCEACNVRKNRRDEVFYNLKFNRIRSFGILSRLWCELRHGKLYFTYCVGQDGNVEYPLIRKILYHG